MAAQLPGEQEISPGIDEDPEVEMAKSKRLQTASLLPEEQ